MCQSNFETGIRNLYICDCLFPNSLQVMASDLGRNHRDGDNEAWPSIRSAVNSRPRISISKAISRPLESSISHQNI